MSMAFDLMNQAVDSQDQAVLLLEGGVDVSPSRYGEKNLYSGEGGRRDDREFALLEHAVKIGLPVLGICRGHQLMNVFFGGSLYQDLYTQRQADHAPTHEVLMYDVFEDYFGPEYYVNSYHHQGLARLASNGIVTACHHDGLVEGMYYPKERGVSVQWHPEFMDDRKFVSFVESIMFPASVEVE